MTLLFAFLDSHTVCVCVTVFVPKSSCTCFHFAESVGVTMGDDLMSVSGVQFCSALVHLFVHVSGHFLRDSDSRRRGAFQRGLGFPRHQNFL